MFVYVKELGLSIDILYNVVIYKISMSLSHNKANIHVGNAQFL